MLLARRLDSGENIELDTESKFANNNFVIKSNFADYENITKSELENHQIIIQSTPSRREGETLRERYRTSLSITNYFD
ncbi:hypothetical protein [Nostoc sp. ChiQUE01b]|uniref:hypothetical protein n=1 Tax=Nostoc sp. ChiQUE01b TaxID=3075376 RepID=UPI002AD48479|nr:hypothetical protein [Nostoc sp. ChiQUE01b]MDZ8262415.1 hypothetical protein [Nostoc sp. ChiQUE01b]